MDAISRVKKSPAQPHSAIQHGKSRQIHCTIQKKRPLKWIKHTAGHYAGGLLAGANKMTRCCAI
jgi:hypothetical protein